MKQLGVHSQEELSTIFGKEYRRGKRQITRNGGKIEFLAFKPTIEELFGKGYDAWKVHMLLREKHAITMSYRTFARYFRQLKMKTPPKPLLQAQKSLLSTVSAPERKKPEGRFQYKRLSAEELAALF